MIAIWTTSTGIRSLLFFASYLQKYGDAMFVPFGGTPTCGGLLSHWVPYRNEKLLFLRRNMILTSRYSFTSVSLVLRSFFLSSSNLRSYSSSSAANGQGLLRITWWSDTAFSSSSSFEIWLLSSVEFFNGWRLFGIGNSACSLRSPYTRMILRSGTFSMYSLCEEIEQKMLWVLKEHLGFNVWGF